MARSLTNNNNGEFTIFNNYQRGNGLNGRHVTIGATALWDSWDASPPTLEIMGTKCIWSPPTFVTIFAIFSQALWEAKFKGEMGKVGR